MIDLVCLVADKNIEAAIEGILQRPGALGIREVQFEVIVHPNRDPGCFHQASELLAGYRDSARHALVVLDRAWDGAPADTGIELERQVEVLLRQSSLGDWARALVLDPELETWVFSDSPHVASSLGWPEGIEALREALAGQHLWQKQRVKPTDPKAAVEWALRRAKKPRSSSMYRELAGTVGFARCQDHAFMRLRELLSGWFGGDSRED